MITITLTRDFITKQAKTLRDFLKKKQVKITPNSSLEILSKSYGYNNWNTLSDALDKGDHSTNENQRNNKDIPDDDGPSRIVPLLVLKADAQDHKPLTFHLYEEDEDDPSNQDGSFMENDDTPWLELDDEFDEARGMYESGECTLGEFIDKCMDILQDSKFHYIDAFCHIGGYLFELNYFQEAESWYRGGVNVGLNVIGEHDHPGRISYENMGNRPFLRCHHGQILSELKLGNTKRACDLMEEHLRWNPGDRLGVGAMLGPAYLELGKVTKAKSLLKKYENEDTESKYMLALLDFRNGKFAEAATMLRKAFIENQYMAEIFLGNPHPKQRLVTHYSNTREVQWAQDALTPGMIKAWRETPDATRFLDWLYNSSLALKDRAEMMNHLEVMTMTKIDDPEREVTARSSYGQSISLKETKGFVRKAFNVSERENWPWEEDALSRAPWRKGEEPEAFKA